MSKKYSVCIDLNGVLDTYSGWKGPDHMDPPAEGAREFLEEFQRRGLKVIIHSSVEEAKVKAWLEKYDLAHLVDEIYPKPTALFYIDDRAVQFNGDFDEVLEKTKRGAFKPHWQK
jgi:predicted HAD superfamily phosphohydrolase YqeG